MRDRTIILDINSDIYKILKYKQFDNNNSLKVVIKDDNEDVDITKYGITSYFKLPKGEVLKKECSVIDLNVIEIIITSDILSQSGIVSLEITLSNENQIVTLFRISLNVEKSINRDDSIILPEQMDVASEIEGIKSTYATKEYVDEKLDNLDIDIDFDNIPNIENIENEIDNIKTNINNIEKNVTNIEKDINNIENNIGNIEGSINNIEETYPTKEYVDEQIANIDIDTSNLATKEDVEGKADNLFKTDMLTVSSLGGIPSGTNLNDMSLQDVLSKLLFPYIAPTVTASVLYSPSGTVFEYGQTIKVASITANVGKKSEEILSVKYYQNNVMINEKTDSVSQGGSFVYAFSTTVTSSINNSYFQVKVKDASNNEVTANTTALNFYYPYYYGVIGANENITSTLIKSLTKQVVAKGNKTYTFSPNYQRIVIAYPKSYGVLKSILDPNGFEQINSFTNIELSIVGLDGTSQAYYVYFNDASTNTNFTMKFNY